MKKLTYLFLALIIVACSSDDSSDGSSDGDNSEDYSESCLYTLEVTNITGVTATLNGGKNIANCDSISIINQGFVYATTIQPTINDIQVNVNGTSLITNIDNLNLGTTYYVRTFLTYDLGEIYGNEVSFRTPNPFYLADNGVTIKAYEWAEVGDTGVINGDTYTMVDETMLRAMIDNDEDISKVVTTKVTDMYWLFQGTNSSYFNPDISSWDVSNVTNMALMFASTLNFEQDISNWDVSNVTDMDEMFSSSTFNQPIGNWDVSSVTDMNRMFKENSSFNQPLDNWDVSSVTDMWQMFRSSAFNQPIGNWDVSSVTDMRQMFEYAIAFNQDLNSWSVDNVTDCANFNYYAPQWTLPKPNLDPSCLE